MDTKTASYLGYHETLSMKIGGLVRGQANAERGDLFGLADPADRLAGDEGGTGRFVVTLRVKPLFDQWRPTG